MIFSLRTMIAKILCIIVLFFYGIDASANNDFKTLSLELNSKVLPFSAYINFIERDNHGLLWISSSEGIYSYDGFNLLFHKALTSHGEDPYKFILKFDPSTDLLWIGTSQGMQSLNTNNYKIKNYPFDRYNQKEVVITDIKIVEHSVFVSTKNSFYKKIDGEFTRLYKAPDNIKNIRTFVIINNNVLIGTKFNGLLKLNLDTLVATELASLKTVDFWYMIKYHSELIISSKNVIYFVDKETLEITKTIDNKYPKKSDRYAMLSVYQNKLVASFGDEFLYFYDLGTDVLNIKKISKNKGSYMPSGLVRLSDKYVVLSFYNGGVKIVDVKNTPDLYSSVNKFLNKKYFVFSYSKDNYWFATRKGIYKVGQNFSFPTEKVPYKFTEIKDIVYSGGKLYIKDFGQLKIYDPLKGKLINIVNKTIAEFDSLYLLNQLDQLLIEKGNKLILFDTLKQQAKVIYETKDKILITKVIKNSIFVITKNQFIKINQSDLSVKKIRHDFNVDKITSLVHLKGDLYWVGTLKGIYDFNVSFENNFVKYILLEGEQAKGVLVEQMIMEPKGDFVWIFSKKNVIRMNTITLEKINYTVMNEPSDLQISGKSVYVFNRKMLQKIDLDKLVKDKEIIKSKITQIRTIKNGQEKIRSIKGNVVNIEADEELLNLYFSTFEYVAHENIKFEYKFDSEEFWRTVGNTSNISLKNMGSINFYLRTSNSSDHVLPTSVYRINKELYWYQRINYVYLMFFLLLLATIHSIYLRYVNKVKREEILSQLALLGSLNVKIEEPILVTESDGAVYFKNEIFNIIFSPKLELLFVGRLLSQVQFEYIKEVIRLYHIYHSNDEDSITVDGKEWSYTVEYLTNEKYVFTFFNGGLVEDFSGSVLSANNVNAVVDEFQSLGYGIIVVVPETGKEVFDEFVQGEVIQYKRFKQHSLFAIKDCDVRDRFLLYRLLVSLEREVDNINIGYELLSSVDKKWLLRSQGVLFSSQKLEKSYYQYSEISLYESEIELAFTFNNMVDIQTGVVNYLFCQLYYGCENIELEIINSLNVVKERGELYKLYDDVLDHTQEFLKENVNNHIILPVPLLPIENTRFVQWLSNKSEDHFSQIQFYLNTQNVSLSSLLEVINYLEVHQPNNKIIVSHHVLLKTSIGDIMALKQCIILISLKNDEVNNEMLKILSSLIIQLNSEFYVSGVSKARHLNIINNLNASCVEGDLLSVPSNELVSAHQNFKDVVNKHLIEYKYSTR